MQWKHIAITVGENGAINIYRNGELEQTASAPFTFETWTPEFPPEAHYAGVLSDVRINEHARLGARDYADKES